MRVRIIAIVLLVAAVLGGVVVGRALVEGGSAGGWSHEAGDAWLAELILVTGFEAGRPNVVYLVEAADGDVDSPETVEAATTFIDSLSERQLLTDIESYWSLGEPDFYKSQDGSVALVTARIPGPTSELASRSDIAAGLARVEGDAITVTFGGDAALHGDIDDALSASTLMLVAAALFSVLLIWAFVRNFTAAALIGGSAGVAVSLTLLGLFAVSQIREVPILTVVLGAGMAWGLAAGNGLLVTRRFIAERKVGEGRREAVAAVVGSAGRTVAVASVVAAAAGGSLWFLPTALVRSTGYALGIASLAAGIGSVVVLGFALAILGVGLEPQPEDARKAEFPFREDRLSRWARLRPAVAGAVSVVVLLVVILASISTPLVEPGPETVGAGTSSRRVAQTISSTFATDESKAPFVVARNVPDTDQSEPLSVAYARALSEVDGVARTDGSSGSYVEGGDFAVPDEVTERFSGETGEWYLVPTEGSAVSRNARSAVAGIRTVSAPFRVEVGGAAARQEATSNAVESRLPLGFAVAVLVIVLLLAWLFRSLAIAIRTGVIAVIMTLASLVVVKFGFAEGLLAPLLDFTSTGNVAAVAPPIALALGLTIVAVSLVYGVGSVREIVDASGGRYRSGAVGLASGRAVHLQATVLIALPLAPLVVSEWRTAQVIGATVVVVTLIVTTVGRFLLLPVIVNLAPTRLWPVGVEGNVRTVYRPTASVRQLIASAAVSVSTVAAPVSTPEEEAAPAVAVVVDEVPDERGDPGSSDASALRSAADSAPAPAQIVEPNDAANDAATDVASDAANDLANDLANDVASDVADDVADVEAPVVAAIPEVEEPEVEEPEVGEPEVEEHVGDVPVVAETPEVEQPGVEALAIDAKVAGHAAEEAPVGDPPAEVVIAVEKTEDDPVVEDAVVEERVVEDAVVEAGADTVPSSVDQPPVEEPSVEEPTAEAAAVANPSTAEQLADGTAGPASADAPLPEPPGTSADPTPADQAATGPVRASSVPDAGEREPSAASAPPLRVAPESTRVERDDVAASNEGAAPGTVDVVCLTESVIASIEGDTPFTTEIGSGFVSNPSNNLSRVMEAILRDAATRGGDEVLVYGHASRDRYRWMVVDNGPPSESDEQRARTLAEAQRFIRRVGGIVECRPEGDYTVFVVEIPMAS